MHSTKPLPPMPSASDSIKAAKRNLGIQIQGGYGRQTNSKLKLQNT